MSHPRRSRPIARVSVPLVLLLAAACRDAAVTTAPFLPPFGPAVSEARFGGGNPDFFFAAPLAADPSAADPAFDVGAANGALRPYLRVCVTDGTQGPAGCLADVTAEATGSATGLPLAFDAGSELYGVNWGTFHVDPNLHYRIEIWGVAFATSAERAELLATTFPDGPLAGRPRWLFGWRDIANSASPAPCAGGEAFCPVAFGTPLPVRVRIEDAVFCPFTRACATQFVSSGIDANLEAVLGAGEGASSVQLFIPGQGGTDFALSFEPCTAAEKAAVQAYSALPTFGPCLKTLTPPRSTPIQLTEPVRISYCLEIDDAAIRAQLAVPESQHDLVGVHHFSTDGDPSGQIVEMEAWAHATPVCGDPTSGGLAGAEPRGALGRLADAGAWLLSQLGPQPLVALDRGGGGEGFDLESFYMLALPTRFLYELPGDAQRTAPAGGAVTLRARAVDLNGDPVRGARVKWAAAASPGGGATVPAPPFPPTGLDGIAQVTVTLSPAPGDNVFHATGRGIADDRATGCTLLGGAAGAASCNGPRAEFDPFQPVAAAAFGGVLRIPEGTRLPFTVRGCAPGTGTPTIDGVLSADEWGCARTTDFPVKLSGGPTVTARLYWMNDGQRFHLAVRVPGSDRVNGLRVEWDNDGDAPAGTAEGASYTTAREGGDDVWEFEPGAGAADGFVDAGCSASAQAGCRSADAEFGGAMQTVGAFDNTLGGVTVYEMSHPLASGDLCANATPKKGCGAVLGRPIDVALAPGGRAGFFVTLRMGNGAQGNTQWPGFLHYMAVTAR